MTRHVRAYALPHGREEKCVETIKMNDKRASIENFKHRDWILLKCASFSSIFIAILCLTFDCCSETHCFYDNFSTRSHSTPFQMQHQLVSIAHELMLWASMFAASDRHTSLIRESGGKVIWFVGMWILIEMRNPDDSVAYVHQATNRSKQRKKWFYAWNIFGRLSCRDTPTVFVFWFMHVLYRWHLMWYRASSLTSTCFPHRRPYGWLLLERERKLKY